LSVRLGTTGCAQGDTCCCGENDCNFHVSFNCWLLLVSDVEALRFQRYLTGATSTGAGAGFEQQDALTMTPHAAAAIAII
jgi:hypothetical protein